MASIESGNAREAKAFNEFTPLVKNVEHPELGSKIGIAASSWHGIPVNLNGMDDTARTVTLGIYQGKLQRKLTSQGFNAYLPKNSIDPPIDNPSCSNTPEERARHLINMLNDPSIEAIVQVGGGDSALKVAELLDAYDKNWERTQAKIVEAWKVTRPGQEPPERFFTERLPDENYRDSNGDMHGLPNRGIPMTGYSDIMNIHNILGQRGVTRPYLSDCMEEHALDILTEPNPETKYEGLVLYKKTDENSLTLPDIPLPDKPLPVYATMGQKLVDSFPLELKEDTILMLEDNRHPDLVAEQLQKAQEAGQLKHVKAIVFGVMEHYEGAANVTKDFKEQGYPEPGGAFDLSKLDRHTKFKSFIQETQIPILFTQGTEGFAHGDNTFGHGVPDFKPIAHYAPATLKTGDDGKVTLSIEGHTPQRTLDRYYDSCANSTNNPQQWQNTSHILGLDKKAMAELDAIKASVSSVATEKPAEKSDTARHGVDGVYNSNKESLVR